MNRIIKSFLLCIPSLLFAVFLYAAQSEDARIYFNAGTEKYLQGNFTEAVENLEKAQSLDPQNKRISEFMVKILLDASTQNHLRHNYKQAFIYIQKAQTIAPDNPKVQEMYKLTKGLVSPEPEKIEPEQGEKARPVKPVERKPEEEKKAEKQQVPVRVVQEQKVPRVPATPQPAVKLFDVRFAAAVAAAALAALLSGILFIALAKLSSKRAELEKALKEISDDRAKIMIECEKEKERVRYEHQIGEQYRQELKDKTRREDEKMKMELDLRTKQIREKVTAEVMEKNSGKGNQQEAFLHQQQAKFLETLGDSSLMEDVSSPALESMRERIAAQAENLYEYAPGAALDFLKNTAKNSNPLIRANVVHALGKIAKSETMQILFELYNDTDYRVKREVLKNLKLLGQKIAAKTMIMEPAVQEKIIALLNEEKTRGEWIM